MQAVTTNINPNRLEHTNKRDTGHVLPRDHDQEPKKSFVGWDQEYSSSTTKDQGKNNMGSEMKSMRKPGEESLVVKQEYLSNNVVKPKPVVDNPTGYDPFLLSKRESTTDVLVGGDSNDQDELLSNVEHKDNGGTQTSDPSKRNATEEVQTSSYRPGESSTTSPNNNPSKIAPHHDQEKEHEDDGTKSHPDPSRTIANGYEGTKDVGPPYLTSQPEGGCSPCCSSCSVL